MDRPSVVDANFEIYSMTVYSVLVKTAWLRRRVSNDHVTLEALEINTDAEKQSSQKQTCDHYHFVDIISVCHFRPRSLGSVKS